MSICLAAMSTFDIACQDLKQKGIKSEGEQKGIKSLSVMAMHAKELTSRMAHSPREWEIRCCWASLPHVSEMLVVVKDFHGVNKSFDVVQHYCHVRADLLPGVQLPARNSSVPQIVMLLRMMAVCLYPAGPPLKPRTSPSSIRFMSWKQCVGQNEHTRFTTMAVEFLSCRSSVSA